MSGVDPLFAFHKLNAVGQKKAQDLAISFDVMLRDIEQISPLGGREGAIVRSRLEEACFYAKKAMALQAVNQVEEGTAANELELRAQAAFERYNEQGPNPWKTYDGKDVPRWPALTDQVRAKWRAAVSS